MKILVTDNLDNEGLEVFKQAPQFAVDVRNKLDAETLKSIIHQYDGIIVRSATQLTRDVIDRAQQLRIIGRAGVGLDNVDIQAATKRGIIVMNSPAGNTISTAEHTIALMLALARHLPRAHATLKNGQWNRKDFVGVELQDKTLGIIGLGRIGTEVAKRCQSFGMNVVAYDPYLTVERSKELHITLLPLEGLLRQADFITVHIPLTEESKGLIGRRELALTKKGVRVINCARGGLIDESALAEAIRSGHVAGAALDVFEQEPPTCRDLLAMDQVVATPHLGASTEEAQVSVSVQIAQQVIDALSNRMVRNAVNLPPVDYALYKQIRPYILMAEKLGSFLTQMLEGRLARVRILYSGEIVKLDLKPVTLAILKGLLDPVVKENVNYVNAPLLIKERGIEVTEVCQEQVKDFGNLVLLEAQTDQGLQSVGGTLFGKSEPRIVLINGYRVDAVPEGVLLVGLNHDKPGVIGRIGTLLGEHGINIAGMTFGRQERGGTAITVVNLDAELSPDLLKKARALPDMIDVRQIRL